LSTTSYITDLLVKLASSQAVGESLHSWATCTAAGLWIPLERIQEGGRERGGEEGGRGGGKEGAREGGREEGGREGERGEGGRRM